MTENKGQTIFLSVIGIATLLVAIIGATFAYFTTKMDGTAANVSATTAKIGAVSFTAQGISETEKILPGWSSGNKTVTVTFGKSDYPVDYTCTLNFTEFGSELTDMTLAVSGEDSVTAANRKLTSADLTNGVEIANGTLGANTTGETRTLYYSLTFPETGEDQNDQQGQTITGTVSCATAGATVYYNTNSPAGTASEPSAY